MVATVSWSTHPLRDPRKGYQYTFVSSESLLWVSSTFCLDAFQLFRWMACLNAVFLWQALKILCRLRMYSMGDAWVPAISWYPAFAEWVLVNWESMVLLRTWLSELLSSIHEPCRWYATVADNIRTVNTSTPLARVYVVSVAWTIVADAPPDAPPDVPPEKLFSRSLRFWRALSTQVFFEGFGVVRFPSFVSLNLDSIPMAASRVPHSCNPTISSF